MIQKLRKIIAFIMSAFLLIISLGIYKPNFYGKATISEPTYAGKSEISLNLEENGIKQHISDFES